MWISSSVLTGIFVADGLRYVKYTGVVSIVAFIVIDAVVKVGSVIGYMLS